MIDGLKPYGEYCESGQVWLGRIPKHWTLLPNRAVFEEIKQRNCSDEQMLSVTITRGVIQQRSLLANSSKKDSSRKDKSAYKLVCPGDIAYNKMRAWQGSIGVSDLRGIISPAYVVVYLNAKKNTPNTARIEHDKALGNVMLGFLKDDTEVYKQFVQNDSFRRFATDMVFNMTMG